MNIYCIKMIICIILIFTINAKESPQPINVDLINLFKQTYANETFLPSEIPRNISDIYKGIWMFQKTGKNDFKKINGRAVFKILNEKSAYDSIDIVYGTMTLRDGLYTTNRNSKFLLQGLYFWQSGELVLLANPNDVSSQQSESTHNNNNNNNGFLPKTSNKDEDDDMEMTKTFNNKDRKKNFLQNIQFVFNLNHTISVSDILLQFSKLRNQTGEKSEVFSKKCYYEFYMKFSHFDKFADPEMKKKMNEDPNYFDERNDGSANPFIEQYGVGFSPNCETEMSVSTNSIYFDDYYRKALNYVVFMCLATFIQVVVLLDQVEYTNSQTAISKVSIITIGQQSILDSYLCLVHLTAGLMMEPCFNAFAIASFLKFASFSIFQMRYLLSIWKSKLEGVGNIRIELGVFYMRFYSVLFSGFILLYYFFSFFDIFLIVFYSFWIPQIYSNCIGNYSKSLKMKYVIGTSLSRLYLPFYFLLCPKNFLFVEPKPKLILFLCVWLFMQNLVLYLQDKIGSRFFIPNFLSPPKYDYQHSLDLNLLNEDKDLSVDNNDDKEKDEKIFFERNNNNFDSEKNEINFNLENNNSNNSQKNKKKFFCVICLSDIDLSDHDNSYMITPCNHLYHKQCLLQWMEHKMECCVCKRRLPYL